MITHEFMVSVALIFSLKFNRVTAALYVFDSRSVYASSMGKTASTNNLFDNTVSGRVYWSRTGLLVIFRNMVPRFVCSFERLENLKDSKINIRYSLIQEFR
jgi:hypothetical protein